MPPLPASGARESNERIPPVTPRLLQQRPLPPYSYVPGHTPHPVRDPAGHSFGSEPPQAAVAADMDWRDCEPYLWGIDLFNCGFYWEAHESWEAVWLACGRTGRVAALVQGLIKLAAAGVKLREGNARGVCRHAGRACELLLESVRRDSDTVWGLSPTQLAMAAEQLAAQYQDVWIEFELTAQLPITLQPAVAD